MATYVEIASVTVGSGGAATIGFSSIPNTYTDLLLVGSLRTSDNPGYPWGDTIVSFNNVTTNRSQRGVYGTGSSTASFNNNSIFGRVSNSNATASTFGSFQMYVPNYTSSNYKSVSIDSVSENNGTSALADLIAGLWSDTSVINQITLTPDAGSWVQYSNAYLYGIKKD